MKQIEKLWNRAAYSRSFLYSSLILLGILLSNVSSQATDVFVGDIVHPEIWENVIYEENVQNDKSFAYYQMTISERYFNGTQSLAIKVMPEQFDSDPDLFISKNVTRPTNSLNSQWYCVKQGGDTCIINRNEIAIGDVLYIGIRCINPCQYTLASNWISTIRVAQNNRTQYRLEGFSSNIFEYLVPSTNTDGLTRSVIMSVEPERPYSPIDLYFSLDSVIYQVEERKVEQILTNGAGYTFTENDDGWCTGCFIYLLVDVTFEGRHYITFEPNPRDRTFTTRKKTDIMVSARQQECGLYFTQGANNDVLIEANGYQGDTEVYISGSTRPSNNQDSRRILQISSRVPQKAIFISSDDRKRWGVATGVMNVCAFGFDVSTVNFKITEQNFGGRIDVTPGISYTFNLERNNTRNFRFSQGTLIYPGNISVSMTNHNLTANQAPARLFYRICQSSNPNECFLNETQSRGLQGMIELAPGNVNVQNGNTRTARILHNPANCRNPRSCFYLMTVFYPDLVGPMRTSFKLDLNVTEYQEVSISQKYRNIISQGQYFNYAIAPNSSAGHPFLKGLTIKLESIIGDADLVGSVTIQNPEINQNQLEAHGTDRFDSLTLNKTGNFSLNRFIYLSVYASTFSVYEISFEATYDLEYDQKLTLARPIRESVAYYNMYLQETQESFYSFQPWWAGYENRTMVFFADVIFNNIFFYVMANEYPQFYLTGNQDKNDVVVIGPGAKDYSLDNTYYIRIRPDFQLQDLISQRPYIFNFFAFSQKQSSVFQDIHLNEMTLGYANRTNMHYRHFIIENRATYNFSLIPIIGNPALLLKLSNDPIYPRSENVLSWDFKTDNPGKSRDSIIVTFSDRSGRYAFCEQAGFNLNGGNRSCGFYLAVECQTECIYNITVQIVGRERQALPKYVIEEDYYTGQVAFNQTSYFYYPLSRNQGDMVIVLNKTAPLRQNGDAMFLGSIMPNSAQFALENWTYPTLRNYSIASATLRPNSPEIVEICSQFISTRCSNSSCLLMMGVLGLTPGATTNFRLLVHRDKNKLSTNDPIKGRISTIGQYNYFWFTSNISVSNPNAAWEYTITTSVDIDGQDVDLFVSAIDGRFPTSDDYDFGSDHLGPDDLFISNQSPFFEDAGYNKSNGMIFVVGVKAMTANASYTLMLTGPQKQNYQITNLTTGIQQTRTINARTQAVTDYYKWFNWGQKDFRINLEVSTGNISAFVNFVGEEVFQTNGYQAIPVNQNNSKWNIYLRQGEAGVLRVTKEDIGGSNLFCYFCWYFVTVTTNSTINSLYRIAVNDIPDVGEEVPFITLNTSSTFTLPATGTVTQRKFILDAKDPFEITAQVSNGYLVMYVGLYPNSPLNRFQWKTEGSSRLRVYGRQTDQNLKLGAFYYITLQSGQGRTSFSLQLNQYRTIKNLEDGLIYKEQYWNQEEQVKLYYFQTPSWRGNYRAVISILALTEDFYPTVLLYKNQRTAALTNIDRQLIYPNLRSFNLSFGDNFFAIANQRNVITFTQIFQMTYQFRDVGSNLTFFTMAVYNFQYGMTDRRKPQFKIQVSFDNRTLTSSSSPFEAQDTTLYEVQDAYEFTEPDELHSYQTKFYKEQIFQAEEEEEERESLWERAGDWIVSTLSEAEQSIHKQRNKFLHNKA